MTPTNDLNINAPEYHGYRGRNRKNKRPFRWWKTVLICLIITIPFTAHQIQQESLTGPGETFGYYIGFAGTGSLWLALIVCTVQVVALSIRKIFHYGYYPVLILGVPVVFFGSCVALYLVSLHFGLPIFVTFLLLIGILLMVYLPGRKQHARPRISAQLV